VIGSSINRKRSLPPVKIPILDFTKLHPSQTIHSKKQNLMKKTLGAKSSSLQQSSGPIKTMTAKQALIQQLKGF
jgi:hypothetical protein